ncbi:MAG: glycosyltransferase family 9 protein [Candidatus Omnitrophota bacterium]|jgi:ADP-heptose:LPS heptosyltransferase
MDIDKARKIDYWLGIPLCFLLSILVYISKILRIKNKINKPPEKIAFIKLPELGTVILSYPLLNHIKREYPLAEVFFVTFNKNKDIFKLLGNIIPDSNILTIDETTPLTFVLDTLKIIWQLRRKGVDIIFDLEFFSRFSAIISYLSGSKKRVGLHHYTFEGLYRGSLLTHKIQYNPSNHVSKTYLSFAQAVSASSKDHPQLDSAIIEEELVFPEYASKVKIKESIEKKLKDAGIGSKRRIFLINPGEGVLPLREWPLENFISLVNLLLQDSRNYILIIGTEGATKKSGLMRGAISNSRCIDFTRKTSLEELMELFLISEVLISNDCGLVHLAMLTVIKKFILFGPESPQVFGPIGKNSRIIYSNWPCSPCLSAQNHRNSDCSDNKCLKTIKPETVYNAIVESL